MGTVLVFKSFMALICAVSVIGISYLIVRPRGDFSFLIAAACYGIVHGFWISRTKTTAEVLVFLALMSTGLAALMFLTLCWRDFLGLTESYGQSALFGITILWVGIIGVSSLCIAFIIKWIRGVTQ